MRNQTWLCRRIQAPELLLLHGPAIMVFLLLNGQGMDGLWVCALQTSMVQPAVKYEDTSDLGKKNVNKVGSGLRSCAQYQWFGSDNSCLALHTLTNGGTLLTDFACDCSHALGLAQSSCSLGWMSASKLHKPVIIGAETKGQRSPLIGQTTTGNWGNTCVTRWGPYRSSVLTRRENQTFPLGQLSKVDLHLGTHARKPVQLHLQKVHYPVPILFLVEFVGKMAFSHVRHTKRCRLLTQTLQIEFDAVLTHQSQVQNI